MLNTITPYRYNNNIIPFQSRRYNIKKCHADCCYNAPIPFDYLEKYSDKIVNKVHKTVPLGNIKEYGGFQVFPITNLINRLRNKCPFLTDNNKCNIYMNRPLICREYGTEKSGNLYCDLME